ncbi:oxidoreductase [Tepidicaulis sp. LMO-SS28]|uniref:oxidoreductase n=1 Tax=Tepidicaulis sp. LMO-SS28 TaxID=3447455 RepID=UPI003EE37B83
MTDKNSRVWWITGVSSGLGKAIAGAALACGDIVAGTVRKETDKQAFEEQAPGRAFGFLLDVTDQTAVRKTAAAIEAKTGGVDILVSNAGYGLTGAIEETSLEEARAVFEVNFFGALSVIQAVLPFMRTRRAGRIFNITSVSGLAPWAGTGIYGASKFAMECAGQTLAEEVRPLGIKVTNVEPGGLRTDFSGRSLSETTLHLDDYGETAHLSQRILAGHAGEEPGDPAKAAAAILKTADMEDPPLHLLLGADAMHYAGRKLAQLQAEMTAFAPLTLSTGFDEE